MDTLLITGFPSVLSQRLLTDYINTGACKTIYLLVNQSGMEDSQKALARLKETLSCDSIFLLEGDCCDKYLGLSDRYDSLAKDVTVISHLLEVTDYNLSYDDCWNVNVLATRNLLRFAKQCAKLHVFYHLSSAYVSGCRTGTIFETELDKGQEFKNNVEKTKFEAEVLVQDAMTQIPCMIFRPSMYAPLKILSMSKKTYWWPLPLPTNARAHLHIIPEEVLTQAIVSLGKSKNNIGKVFHLDLPNLISIGDFFQKNKALMEKAGPVMLLPHTLISKCFNTKWFKDRTGICGEEMESMLHPVTFDMTETNNALSVDGFHWPSLDQCISATLGRYVN